TAWRPAAAISSATSLAAAPSTSLSTSRAPTRASAIASARPRPFPAPVTIAVRPSRVKPPVALWMVIVLFLLTRDRGALSLFSLNPRDRGALPSFSLNPRLRSTPLFLLTRGTGEHSPLVAGTAQHTAVGHELAAGRVRRLVGGEERHQPRDLDRLGEPRQRHRREERGPLAVVGLGLPEGHAGHHAARLP